jgi:hypothetical protein
MKEQINELITERRDDLSITCLALLYYFKKQPSFSKGGLLRNTKVTIANADRILKNEVGLRIRFNPERRRYQYEVVDEAAIDGDFKSNELHPCGLPEKEVDKCMHFRECYLANKCPAALAVYNKLKYPGRIGQINYFSNIAIDKGKLRF